MPVYQCYSPPGLLSESAKARIADEITTIHTSATGAPELFVNVLSTRSRWVTASLAANRRATPTCSAPSATGAMPRPAKRCCANSRGCGVVPPASLKPNFVALTEVDPANGMEAGLVLPEPGREQEWFDENRVRLTQMGMAL